ncbi:MAG: ATP-dependent DNA helicase [Actinomycetota bacterium]
MSDHPSEIVEFLGNAPTDEQWRAISMPLEPYVLIAGAGSGKTSVMAARVIHLALEALAGREGVLPGNVLCLTFTNKATENLVARIRHALRVLDLDEGEEPEIANYHGFAASLLQRYGMYAGVEPGQRVLQPIQRAELCAKVLDLMPFEHFTTQWQPSMIDAILTLDDQLQNHFVAPEQVIAFNEERLEALSAHRSDRAYAAALERIELARAATLFRAEKRRLGVLDYGDQIELALRAVQAHPEIAAEYKDRFPAVLLDEYQDTNVAQARLMAAVFGEGHPVTAVGDPDQNIYAWRGASLFNLLEFPTAFPRADGSPAEVLPLFTNFRSGARILAAADTVIAPLPPDQRPADKQLTPWPENGEGEVGVTLFPDEVTEAEAIADRAVELHAAGQPWREAAVLCRTSRLFSTLQLALSHRDVPVEIVGLAGLLQMPEVVEVLAYARVAADPGDSVALARILLGPRYRIGARDMARLAAWAKTQNPRDRSSETDDDLGPELPVLLAEVYDHLDEVQDLSDEALARLEGFRNEIDGLRELARRPVGAFLAEVVRRTGLLAELDAEVDRHRSTTSRRNLAAFLDEVHAFAPLEGELTMRAFLAYIDALMAVEKQEWSPVQPTEDDSVKVMTIHAAKGLEFDSVFVPGMATGVFPDTRVHHNPAQKGRSLDFELRGDAAILPRYDGVLKHFKEQLTAQELIEERRTCYVALTRARRHLHASSAHWYGELFKAKGPGVFFDELCDWGERSGLARTDRSEEQPEENPLLGFRENLVRDWPEPALRPESDALFAEGWRPVAVEAAASGAVQPSLLESLAADERSVFDRVAGERVILAAHLREREDAGPPDPPSTPSTLSVSSVIEYGRCPKRFYWSAVRPLPRFSGPAARIGTEVHRWIEIRARGQATLLETDEAPDVTVEELAGEPGKIATLQRAFERSRLSGVVPLAAERPFLLRVGDATIRGRIDAIYGELDGDWEIVDYKTGRVPAADDPLARLQLDLYALACIDVWGKRPEQLTLTYLYLASEAEVSYVCDAADEIRDRVGTTLRGIADERFDPTPGPQCRYCDFRPFCDAGTAWLADAEATRT